MKVSVELSGGLELMFENQTHFKLDVAEGTTIKDLIKKMRDEHLKERPELFVSGETVRPGILVLVDDTDWELLGGLEYQLEEGNDVVFISTLHGG